MQRQAIAVPDPVVRYRRDGEARLVDRLRAVDLATVIDGLERVESVLLSPTGGVVGRPAYRYTVAALSQVCSQMCPGLWRLMAELGGVYDTQPVQAAEVQTSIAVFNAVAACRFAGRLAGRQLVASSDGRTIDGVIGPSYLYLSNHALLERLAAAAAGGGSRFLGASLCARRLQVCYVWPAAAAVGPAPRGAAAERYRAGVVVTNSETGDCAVRTRPVWARFTEGETVLLPRGRQANRLVHVGRRFDEKLDRLLAVVFDGGEDADAAGLADGLRRLRAVRLDAGGVGAAAEAGLRRHLARYGLPGTLCAAVVKDTAAGGADGGSDGPSATLRGRTAFDLLVSVLRCTRGVGLLSADAALRAAQQMLTVGVRLGSTKGDVRDDTDEREGRRGPRPPADS